MKDKNSVALCEFSVVSVVKNFYHREHKEEAELHGEESAQFKVSSRTTKEERSVTTERTSNRFLSMFGMTAINLASLREKNERQIMIND